MIVDGFEYDKTLVTKRLIFKGHKTQKFNSYMFALIIVGLSLSLSYLIYNSQISNAPSIEDYLIAFFFPALIIGFGFFLSKSLLQRDKLKEVEIYESTSVAKNKLLKAAENLNWENLTISENFMIFKTKFGVLKDCQTVTLIFAPDQKIYFNSIDFPNDFVRPARFMENYQILINEYSNLENVLTSPK